MSGSSKDVLQGYFDDLLTPQDAEPTSRAPAQQAQPSPEAKRQPETATRQERAAVISPDNSARKVAERLAKQKLARLLKSAPAEAAVEVKVERRVAEKTVTPSRIDAKTKARLLVEKRSRQKAAEAKAVTPKIDEAKAPVIDVPVAPAPAEPELPAAEITPDADIVVEQQSDSLAWLANGRPAWAQERFDVLLFSVSGLTLAVPLIALGQIQPLTEDLTPLFGQADWFMGLQPTPVGKIRTVNTAMFVMPERYDEAFLKSARYVVSIDGLPWGLAVDSVNQPISLTPEDVKWRSERSKRPWLAGTVKEHMCALIDVPAMGQLLQDADANAGKRTSKH